MVAPHGPWSRNAGDKRASERDNSGMKPTAPSRQYDLVLYGATGFVGRQTVAYLAHHPQVKSLGLKWALAGRSASKLQAVRQACGAARAGVLVAQAHDANAIDELARSAAVVLSTAGPFALYGSELVSACVRHGTHYVDITGETPWVKGLIARHHARAMETGARIIPFCGFDSVPSDISALLANQTMWARHGEKCARVTAAFSIRGGFNGGTLASMFNLMATGQAREVADPFLLNPPGTRATDTAAQRDPAFPVHDEDFKAWLGPFFMAPINTRVVRRTAALLGYADGFRYQEYLRLGRGPAAALAAGALSAGSMVGQAAMKLAQIGRAHV